jgi:hypothetical protein
MARLLDHLGIVARELEPVRDAWRRLGFEPTAPKPLLGVDASGAVVPLGQWSCHVVLESGYVELTAVAGDDPSHHLARYRQRYVGLHILALGADDAAAARERVVHAGLRVTPVMQARRAIDYGARQGEARFRWFMLDATESPEALVCVVEHETPELVFQPEVSRHPNGAIALDGTTLLVAAPEALAGSGIVPPALPWLALARFRVRDRAATERWFASAGVALQRTAEGVAWVPPDRAGGAVVEFT